MTGAPGESERSAEVRRGAKALMLGAVLGGMLFALAKKRTDHPQRLGPVDSKDT